MRSLKAPFSRIFFLREAKSSNSCTETSEVLRLISRISIPHLVRMIISPPGQASQLLRDADKEAAARPELRREHPDAGAIPALVAFVEQVNAVERHGRWLGPSRHQ